MITTEWRNTEWRERLERYGWYSNLPDVPGRSYQSPVRRACQIFIDGMGGGAGSMKGHWIDVYDHSGAWVLRPALDEHEGLKGEGTTTESLEAVLMAVAIFEALP